MSHKPVDSEVIRLVEDSAVLLTAKADRKLAELKLEREDVRLSILNGHETKRKRDPENANRWIYSIVGPAFSGRQVYSAGKIVRGGEGRSYLLITIEWAD